MWDNAASLCFIANTKAKQKKIKGSKVELSVIKVGAQSQNIKTIKYKVPLIDTVNDLINVLSLMNACYLINAPLS